MPPPSLAALPLEVILDNLLPLLPLAAVLALGATSSEYAAICADDTFWKRKLAEDYNFADASSARTRGYKFLYRGVHNAKLYVWGCVCVWHWFCCGCVDADGGGRSAGEGRLGLGGLERGGIRRGSMPYPVELKVPGARIVELAAGGW